MAEGIDLPGSDVDIMYIINKADVIQNEQIIEHKIHHTTLVMELDNDHSGFAKLRLIVGEEQEYEFVTSKCCECNTNCSYLSVQLFLHKIKHNGHLCRYFSTIPLFEIVIRIWML